MEKSSNRKNELRAAYLIMLFYVFAFSCTQSHSNNIKSDEKPIRIKQPVTVLAGSPFKVNLDTCPPPQVVEIQINDSMPLTIKTPWWERKIMMVPPIIKPADFFIPMPRFSNEEGLEAHSVYSSLRDRNGNLWFGTHGGGVTRFDGKTAVTFPGLGCNDVQEIMEDSKGNIWFGMGGCGLVKYDGRGITNFTTAHGLINNEVRALCQDSRGNIWIGTDGYGVSCFDGKSFSNFTTQSGLLNNKVMAICEDKKGNIWMGTDAGPCYYDGKKFNVVIIDQGSIHKYVRSILCDKNGVMWFGTVNGVSRYAENTATHFSTSQGLVNNNVTSLKEDNAGNIWIGTYGGGVSKYDGKIFQNFTKKQGLASDVVMTITEDKSGNLWFGAEGGGVTRYEGSAVNNFSTEQGLINNYVISVLEDKKGNVWLGSRSDGVSRYDVTKDSAGQKKTFTNFRWQQGFPQVRVNAMMQDTKENIWFCTNAGFSKYDEHSFTNYYTSHGILNTEVRCVMEDSTGKLWFGMENGGISIFDGKTITNFTTAQGLPSNNVRVILNDADGNFWIATFGNGLSRFDGKSFINFNTEQGLVENTLLSMKKDRRGNLWIGSSNSGVSILRKEIMEKIGHTGKEMPQKIFEKFTTQEGLANDVVYDIAEDKHGNIFIGTNFGLTVIKCGILPGKSIQRTDIEYYNQKTGYPIKDMNGQAMYADSKGKIWGGTGHDLISFDYAAVHKNLKPPNVSIQGVKINNEEPGWYNLQSAEYDVIPDADYLHSAVELEEKIFYGFPKSDSFRDSLIKKFNGIKFDSIARFYPVPVNLVIPHKHNNITIEFGAIEPAKPQFVKYQYILEGYDSEWNPVSDKTNANFGNIYEGSYTFKVKALSPDGVWSEPIAYSFTVLPPWYRSWWAYLIYTLLFVLMFYIVYKIRIGSLEKKQSFQLQTIIATQEDERKRISRDLHDDVGTKLSALKLFLSSLKNNADKKQYVQVDLLATNSEQLINETIKDVREMLLNLSPGILDEFGFITAIEGLIGKINQTNTIYFELSLFGMKDNLKKGYALSLYRITQELINNVLKHSEAKNVALQIGYREEKIIIMIEDDGKGFDLSKHKDGYGLKNLETRTKLLNGTMNIDSQVGKGTSVFIELPYKFN